VSKTCLVRFDSNKYSVSSRAVGRPVEVQAYADRIVIRQDGVIVAEHTRCFGRNETIYDPWHYAPVLARKPGALRNGAPFKDWLLPASLERVRRKLKGSDDGDRQMVVILSAVLMDGLVPVEAACAEAIDQNVHSADVILNILARKRDPAPTITILTPAALQLQHAPVGPNGVEAPRERRRRYGATIKDALTALWEASDRVCGKRLKVMIPILLSALEQHGRLKLGQADRDRGLAISAATIDRLLGDANLAASGGRRRAVSDSIRPSGGKFPSARSMTGTVRRQASARSTWWPMAARRWRDRSSRPLVDIATGWTECLPLLTRDGSLVVEAMKHAQSLFPWLLRGVDFDNDSAFMNDVVAPWCREQKLEVTRSRAYKKNDQAFVEQKNGAVVRRLMGYGRFDGVETARVMGRLYAAARLYVNFFPAVVQAQGEASRGCEGHQTLSSAGHTVRTCPGTSETRTSDQAARDLWHSRSRATAGRDPCGAAGTRRADRQARSRDGSRQSIAG
jgi:hypothetical protein